MNLILKKYFLKIALKITLSNFLLSFKKSLKNGLYPLISPSSINNRIAKYVNKYTFNGHCITVASNGSVGSSFCQENNFCCTSDVIVLIPKIKLSKNTLLFITNQLTKYKQKYNYSYKWSISRMKNDELCLPILNNEIDETFINNLMK